MESAHQFYTDEQLSGIVTNGAGGRLLLTAEGEGFPIHFVDIDSHKLQVGDRVSGRLFVYRALNAGFMGYVYPGSIIRE